MYFGDVIAGCIPVLAWVAMLGMSLTFFVQGNESHRVGMWFVLALPVIFLGHWHAAGLMIPLLAWSFWLGDNESWLWNVVAALVCVVAGGVTILITARVIVWRAGTRYAWLNTIGTALWLVSFFTYEYLRRVDGLAAESAARHIAERRIFRPEDASFEETLILKREVADFVRQDNSCRTFLVSDADGPRCRVTICRHGPFWKEKLVDVFPARQWAFYQAKESLELYPERAPGMLDRIVKNYPGTPEADAARQILSDLNNHSR